MLVEAACGHGRSFFIFAVGLRRSVLMAHLNEGIDFEQVGILDVVVKIYPFVFFLFLQRRAEC